PYRCEKRRQDFSTPRAGTDSCGQRRELRSRPRLDFRPARAQRRRKDDRASSADHGPSTFGRRGDVEGFDVVQQPVEVRRRISVVIQENAADLFLSVAVFVGAAGWFFLYAVFALVIRRNDAFNTITSIFYFVFLFASSMFYPIDPLPVAFRAVALVNPITWHVDVMRFATIGLGDPRSVALEAAGFVAFTLVSFA